MLKASIAGSIKLNKELENLKRQDLKPPVEQNN
jgi:hypothetical protein